MQAADQIFLKNARKFAEFIINTQIIYIIYKFIYVKEMVTQMFFC